MRKFLFGLLGVLWAIPSWALPAGYTELEYIESSGTQYIDTGVSVNNRNSFEIQYKGLSEGDLVSQGSNSLRITTSRVSWFSDHYHFVANPSADDFHIIDFGYDYMRVDGVNITGATDHDNASGTSVFLFARNSSDNNSSAQVKYFKIYDASGTLVRNLVPARRNSDNVLGMYDTVGGRFYTNAGSGSFVAGPIACDGERVAYTSATGTVVQNGTPTPTNPIEPTFYTQGNMVLRKVGNYADSYDATTGKITRRVGEYIITGNEDWHAAGISENMSFFVDLPELNMRGDDNRVEICNLFTYRGFIPGTMGTSNLTQEGLWAQNGDFYNRLIFHYTGVSVTPNAENWKEFLATKYAAGTPVTIWYPLATPVEETVPASYCQQNIRVATTKYVETQFSDLGTRLAAAVATVNTVVSNTITQAASIATLQSGKQTRPADDPTDANNTENCPAGKKCLLVEDASGVPHWYEIFDPINRWMEAFFKTNPNGQYVNGGADFRRWQGNPNFRETYIDGNRVINIRQWTAATPARTIGGMYQTLIEGDLENAGTWAIEYDGTEGDGVNAGVVYGIAKCTSVAGTFANKLTSAQEAAFYELPTPVGQTDRTGYERENFKNCWCKMTAVGVPGADGTAANGSVYPVNVSSSAWTFRDAYNSAADCASYCSGICAGGVRADASFRTAVFGLSD